MVRGQHEQDRILAVAFSDLEAGGGDSRCSVPAKRLEYEVGAYLLFGKMSNLSILILDLKEQLPIGDRHDVADVGQSGATQKGLL